MYYCNVLKNTHMMFGADFHLALPPPIGLPPIPNCFHFSFGVLKWGIWGAVTAKSSTNVLCEDCETMQRGTDIGFFVIHISIPHFLLPVYNILTGSKSEFGVSRVLIEEKPVAVAVLVLVNLNLNCFTAWIPSVGFVLAPNTVQAYMTLGDFLAGLLSALLDWLLQALFNKLMSAKWLKKIFDRWVTGWLVRRLAPGLLERLPQATLLTTALNARYLGSPLGNRYVAYTLGELAKGLFGMSTTGSPLGYSFPWTPGGGLFDTVDPSGTVFDLVTDYYNDATIPEYSSQP